MTIDNDTKEYLDKHNLSSTGCLLPVPYTYFTVDGEVKSCCFLIPIPEEKGVSVFGVDINKILDDKNNLVNVAYLDKK